MRTRALQALVVAGTFCILTPADDVAGRGTPGAYRTATPNLRIWAHPLPGSDGGTVSVELELAPETQNHEIYVTLGSDDLPLLCAGNSGV